MVDREVKLRDLLVPMRGPALVMLDSIGQAPHRNLGNPRTAGGIIVWKESDKDSGVAHSLPQESPQSTNRSKKKVKTGRGRIALPLSSL